jgi:acetoin utilization protein AcuB
MIVRFWMTKTPKVATPEMTLDEVLRLLRANKIRRLPVVRNENEVCGIVTDSDLYRYVEPHIAKKEVVPDWVFSELSKYRVDKIMSQKPFTCTPNTPLEFAGELMRKQKVSALPVLENGKLTGIITESDIMEALTELARLYSDGKRICFKIPLEEKFLVFYKVVEMCEQYGLDILTLLTHPIENDTSHIVMIRVRGDKSEEFIKELWKSNYKVLMVNETEALPQK